MRQWLRFFLLFILMPSLHGMAQPLLTKQEIELRDAAPEVVKKAAECMVEISTLDPDAQGYFTNGCTGILVVPGWVLCPRTIQEAPLLRLEIIVGKQQHSFLSCGQMVPPDFFPAPHDMVWLRVPDLGIAPIPRPQFPALEGTPVIGLEYYSPPGNSFMPGRLLARGSSQSPSEKLSAVFFQRKFIVVLVGWPTPHEEEHRQATVQVFDQEGHWLGFQIIQDIASPEPQEKDVFVPAADFVPPGSEQAMDPWLGSARKDLLQYWRNHNWQEMEVLSRTLKERFPEDPDGWFFHGRAKGALKQYAEAIQDLRRAIALAPKDLLAPYSLAKFQLRALDFEGARDSFITYFSEHPELMEDYKKANVQELVNILHLLGDHTREGEWHLRWCKALYGATQPAKVEEFHGHWLEKHGYKSEAIKAYKHAFAILPSEDREDVWWRIVSALHKLGRHEEEEGWLQIMERNQDTPAPFRNAEKELAERVRLRCLMERTSGAALAKVLREYVVRWGDYLWVESDDEHDHKVEERLGELIRQCKALKDPEFLLQLAECTDFKSKNESRLVGIALLEMGQREAALKALGRAEPDPDLLARLIRSDQREVALALNAKWLERHKGELLEGLCEIELGHLDEPSQIFDSTKMYCGDGADFFTSCLLQECFGNKAEALRLGRMAKEKMIEQIMKWDCLGAKCGASEWAHRLAQAFVRLGSRRDVIELLKLTQISAGACFDPSFEGTFTLTAAAAGPREEYRPNIELLMELLEQDSLDGAIENARQHLGYQYLDEAMWLRLGGLYLKKRDRKDATVCLQRLKALGSSKAGELEKQMATMH